MHIKTLLVISLYLIAHTGIVQSAITASPDRISLTVNQAELSKDGENFITLTDTLTNVAFDNSSKPFLGEAKQVSSGNYKVLRLKLDEISWHATWTAANHSPCTDVATGTANGTVDLGGRETIYFKTPDMGGNTPVHYAERQPLNGYIGDDNHPFVMAAPIKVRKGRSTSIDLVFSVNDTLTCDMISHFKAGESGNQPPERPVIGGPVPSLSGVEAMYVDKDNDEVGLANAANNTVTLYDITAQGAVKPVRTISGPNTRLNNPSGIAIYIPVNETEREEEIVVSNRGNNSVTTFSRLATDNPAPLRSFSGERTELDEPVALGLYIEPTGEAPELDEIWVANRGNDSITAYSLLSEDERAEPLHRIRGEGSGLDVPCGLYVDIANDEIGVANSGNNSITIYSRPDVDAHNDSGEINVEPLRTISGPDTGLDEPCGLYLDTANDEIGVANKNSDNILIFPRTADGNVSPRIIEGAMTGLNQPHDIDRDPSSDTLWVAHKGTQVNMSSFPTISPVSTNTGPGQHALSGNYNVIVYKTDYSEGINGFGIPTPVVSALRGTANFSPDTDSGWPRFTFRLENRLKRRILQAGCFPGNVDTRIEGFYGVNDDGSFYTFLKDQSDGSIQGAVSPDGNEFVGTIHDSSDELLLIYGIKETGLFRPHLTDNGRAFSNNALYAYTTYRTDIFSLAELNDRQVVRYLLGIGAARTSSDMFLGSSGDANLVALNNPVEREAETNRPNVIYRSDFSTPLRQPSAGYTSHAGGLFEISGQAFANGMAGAISRSGDSMVFITNIVRKIDINDQECPNDIGFGIGLRTNESTNLKRSDLDGTYFIAGFGDQNIFRNTYRATNGTITFDGKGTAEIELIENTGGSLSTLKDTFTYEINTRSIPSMGETRAMMDVVDFFGQGDSDVPFASGLVGNNHQSLTFYRTLVNNPRRANEANPIRLLGLAIFQHP